MHRLRSSTDAGAVRLAAPVSYGRHVLAPALASFRALYPGVTGDLRITGDGTDGVDDDADIVLRVGRDLRMSPIARRVGTARLALYASPAYLARRGMPRHPSELPAHDCLTCDAVQPRPRWALRHAPTGESHEAAIEGVLSSDSIETLAVAAIHGAGIVMLPDLLAGDLVWEAQLQPVLQGWEAEPWGIHLACSPQRQHLLPVRKLMDHLIDAIAEMGTEIPLPSPAAQAPMRLRAVEALA
jgi:DNA-binding transcriptional LysR family regulator